MKLFNTSISGLMTILAIAAFAGLAGCEQKEEVLDVETPGGEVEVESDEETGAVDVDVDDN